MKSRNRKATRQQMGCVEYGQYVVADPSICHGKLTFKGTRIFVADILGDVERGLSWDFIIERWGPDRISKAAIAEAVRLASVASVQTNGPSHV